MTEIPQQEYYNVAQLSRISGKAVNTIKAAMNFDKTKDPQKQLNSEIFANKKMIAAHEIIRWTNNNAYPCDFTKAEKTPSVMQESSPKAVKDKKDDADSDTIELLKDLLDSTRKEAKEREEVLWKQLEEKDRQLEQAQRIKLLEDNRAQEVKDAEKSLIENLQERIADLKASLAEKSLQLEKYKIVAQKRRKKIDLLELYIRALEEKGWFALGKPKRPELLSKQAIENKAA